MDASEQVKPADAVGSSEGLGVTVSARPLEWSLAYDDQWIDEHHGFSIMREPDDELPFSAAWGEGDSEQFSNLEQAKAWCQAEIDAWVRRWVLVTPNR